MRKIVQTVAIFSMVGMMQMGIGTGVIEAAPQDNQPVAMQQHDGPHGHDRDRDRERHERRRFENERHDREMRRHPHESERDWYERQRWENRRHEDNLRDIARDIIEIIFDR